MSRQEGTEPRLATCLDGRPWDNAALLEELKLSAEAPAGHWAIWNWENPTPAPSLLEIQVAVPQDSNSAAATHEFLDGVAKQLKAAFMMYSSERGWPEPGYRLRRIIAEQDEWSYRISLQGGPTVEGWLKPNKLLAMGDETQLAPLLGLETLDPVLGLPAKWIGKSQMGPAQSGGLHVFDGPGVITAHTLHMLTEVWQLAFGFLEVQRWLLSAVPTHAMLLGAVMPAHAGLFLKTLKDFVADGLWLPHSAQFLELFAATLPELQPDEKGEAELLKELMRREIVPFNLGRYAARDGILRAVEWRGEPEGDDADQARLLLRLSEALTSSQGGVVITDFENRPQLGEVLRGPFPGMPVLSWAEMPPHARIEIVAVVDARLEVDPSPWPYATFQPEEQVG